LKTTTRFDDNLKRLRYELVKLEKSPGTPLARRNARARVLAAARLLRAAVDREYPVIIVRTGVKRLKTFAGRLARLENSGWAPVDGSSEAGYYAAAGVPVKRLRHKDPNGSNYTAWLIPTRAKAIGVDTARLRAAKRSRALKRGALTAQALSQ
jgi:hypothetical protein